MKKKIDISKLLDFNYNKNKIMSIFCVFLLFFVIGFFLIFIGTGGVNNTKFQEVTVIEENKYTVKVQVGSQLGDPIVYEMKKTLIFSPKEGDKIYIRYNTKKPDQIHYFINPDILTKIGVIIIFLPYLAVIIFVTVSLYYFVFIKGLLLASKLSITKKIIYLIVALLSLTGFFLSMLGSNENEFESIEIIGVMLFVVGCLILSKKNNNFS